MDQIFDLFGDPVPANRGQRGRPEHIPTHQNRNRVSMLVALGLSNKRIAAALFVTLPTLRKHYFSELKYRDVARDRLDANPAAKLWELFMGGRRRSNPPLEKNIGQIFWGNYSLLKSFAGRLSPANS